MQPERATTVCSHAPARLVHAANLCSAGIAFCIFALLAGKTSLWSESAFMLFPSGSYGSLIGVLLLTAGLGLWLPQRAAMPVTGLIAPAGFSVGTVLIFATDWICRGYNLFQGPTIRGELILGAVAAFFLIKRSHTLIYSGFLLFTILFLFTRFFDTADGRLLVSDDHASFVFRLMALKDNFPSIPFYSPLWNGGFDARDFFATGALNVFFLFSPLIYLFKVESIYNVIVATTIFVLLPCSVYAAARLQKLPTPTPALAAIIALGSNLLWYRWGLKYGTMGFVTSVSLLPFVSALAVRVVDEDEPISPVQAALFVVTASLVALWSLAAVALLPIAIFGLFRIAKLLRKRFFPAIVLSLLVLNVPWITLFLSVSRVTSFVTSEQPSYAGMAEGTFDNEKNAQPQPVAHRARAGSISAQKSLKTMREHSIGAHPLLLFLTIPGLLLLPGIRRSLSIATLGWLIGLGCVFSPLKPQLELDRMLVVAGVLASLPAALALTRLLSEAGTQIASRIASIPCLAFLFVTPLSVASVVNNHSIEQYYFASPLIARMRDAIIEHGGAGRVLFSGFVLHDLSNGHLAPMAFMSKKPLMASSPFHNQWRHRQIFPKSFMQRLATTGVEDYLDLYNVSSVMAHEREWRQYFLARPDQYTPVWKDEKFWLFQRTHFPNSLFLRGSGELIAEHLDSIKIKPGSPEVVLRYNYLPFLTSSACSISSEQVAPEVSLIKLSACPLGQEVEIRSVTAWKRVLQ